jgi:hypothetical protein
LGNGRPRGFFFWTLGAAIAAFLGVRFITGAVYSDFES